MSVEAVPPARTIPGPPPGLFGGSVLAYRRDSLGFLLDNARRYGDIVHFNILSYEVIQLNHPDYVREVLLHQVEHIRKSPIYKQVLSKYLGNGLLISDGEFWKRQRRLAQPAFHTRRVHTYADTMVEYAQDMLKDWEGQDSLRVDEAMMRLTLFIVAKTLFDADVRGDADRVAQALEVLLHSVIEASGRIINLPEWVPTPNRRRENLAIDTLNDVTMRIIRERRASGQDTGDLLSMLLLARDDDGQGMSDQQVRDEALTIFLAGHETTANALTWTFYLLSQNPEVEAKLHEELERVLQGRTPGLTDVPNLTYTEMVLKESMRLYPPAHGIGRQSIDAIDLGDGYVIPPRAGIMISAYVLHRDERWFPDPERFDPDRFTPEREAQIPKFAYMPFGGGPRICIGNRFAMMEAVLILASVAQRYRLTLDPAQQVVPEPLVTLRPKYGMKMHLHAR